MKRAPAMHFTLFANLKNKFRKSSKKHIKSAPRVMSGIALSLLMLAFFAIPSIPVEITSGETVSAFDESIATVSSTDCATAKSTWNLGQSACARALGAPLAAPPTPFLRRFVWVAPDGNVAQIAPITTDPATDTYAIPTAGQFAQVGIWTVKTIDNRGVGRVSATFSVLSATAPNADLAISKTGPTQAVAGGSVTYTMTLTNNGPDDAQTVVVKDAVPAHTAFVSETHVSGPTLACTTAPDADGVDTTTCTLSSLAANTTAVFTIMYNIDAGTPDGTVLFNQINVSSSTNEVNSADNTSAASTRVGSTTACSLTCPGNVTQDNDAGQCGASVSYSSATGSNCLGITCNPPSGSFFPIGSTSIICAGDSGNPCSFTVTVHDTRSPVQPTISCPSNVNVSEEFPNSGSATVNYASPSATGNCVTTSCAPASGSVFNVGTTTVTCTATDSSNTTATCSFTVTVTGNGCTLTCPGDITESAPSGQCNKTVNYSSPTTTGSCGAVSCSPGSGSTFPVGTTTVVCTSAAGPSCDFLVTVVAAAAPTITTCATNKAVPADANCEGVIPNLVSEVVATGCNVTISQSPAAGSVVAAGNYTVTITAENSAGQATCTATVRVDNQAPVITCPSNVVVYLPLNSTATSMAVSYAAVTATDNCGTPTVSSTPASGSIFPVGVTTVTGTATDDVGNTSNCSFTVTVLYDFAGFFSPVGNPPTLNVVNAGRAVPVKFSLSGNKGLSIFASGSPSSGQIACDVSAPPSEVTETVSAGSSSLSYDASTDQYSYIWKTDTSWAGTCRQLILTLNDGTQHVANFKFR